MALSLLRRAVFVSLVLGGAGAQAPATPPAPVPPAAAPGAALPGAALRGLWVDAFGPGLHTPAQVKQTVEDAARLGVNTLFVQAIRRADCLCLNASVPPVSDPELAPGFDPLAAVTAQAHARGMKVIAWVSVTGAANTAKPNTRPGHVFRTHGPAAGAASWLSRRPDGSWQEGRDAWLDPAIPGAADHMAQAVLSLVRRYPVDGVQLDRIRYPDGGAWGYDPKTLARYRAETGRPGTPAPSDPAWQAWKRQQVSFLVRRIALEAKALNPELWISAATITYQTPPADLAAFQTTRTYADVLQDWPGWMRAGWLDLNVLMNYKRDPLPEQAGWFDGWNAFARRVAVRSDGAPVAVAAGTAMYLNSPAVTAAQATRALNAGLGWVGYSYRTPTLDVYGERQSAAQGLRAVREVLRAPGGALAAPGPWTEAAPVARGLLGRITGLTVPGGQRVQAWQGGALVAEADTDANGYYGFAALPPGPTEVRVGGQRWTETVPAKGVVRLPDLLLRDLKAVPAAPVPALPPARP
ncbi:glycoside hydrolase family 10 protein [Deinococcus multiflagellatus]|uniref:glycoside hydrolase family 10 protein n=1 Tax=Deinococcus multiflagellatus TaxID=1656887 RepID=UPI001CCA002C|nr:family 10 glycosylhydrolase [Deinococcus multiflagellatus]MBZ9712490.1 family 10 glycosylhydrolase [Deinococcus multiflagellatus]